jgi:hypothetical protein
VNAVLARIRAAFGRVPPEAILVIGWGLFLVYAYPGYMSTDSVDQLSQARAGHFTDWHPPLMAREWQLIELFVTGPLGMLLLQSGLFLLGVYLLLARVTTPRAAALAASIVMIVPPVMTTMAVIWKDSQMAGFLVLGTALVLSSRRAARRGGWALLFMACGMRYNAAAAILPLALYALWSMARPRWQRVAIAGGATIGLFVSSSLVNGWLTDEKMYPWQSSLALMDIAGTIHDSGPASDAELAEELDGVPLAIHKDLYANIYKAYDARTWWYLSHGDARVFDPPTTDEQRDAISRAWRHFVTSHPVAYFRHRRRVFWHVLGAKTGDEQLWSPDYHALSEDPAWLPGLHHDASPSSIQAWLYKRLDHYQNTWLFRPYYCFWAAILALGLCAYWRRGYESALLASGLTYELSYLFVAPSPDNRYSHWMVACFAIAGAVSLVTARARRARAAAAFTP